MSEPEKLSGCGKFLIWAVILIVAAIAIFFLHFIYGMGSFEGGH
jgi:hypothetical protein